MQLANIETLNIEARALVVREQRGMELALVLDVTGSMCEPRNQDSCTTSGSRIAALKQAAKDLMDIVYGPNDTAEDLYVAVVPFSERVKIGNTCPAAIGWIRGVQRLERLHRPAVRHYGIRRYATGERPVQVRAVNSYPYREDDEAEHVTKQAECHVGTVLPLTASKATVPVRSDALGAKGYTRIDIGAGWGWRVLSERWQGCGASTGLPLQR